MEKIKFRGKRIDNDEWVYGNLFNWKKYNKITVVIGDGVENGSVMGFEVDPTTVGQFTGLKNVNGEDVYEGDLLRSVENDKWEKENYTAYEVFFHDGNANSDYNIGFSMNRTHYHGTICGGYTPPFKPKTVSLMETCGNIHTFKK